MRWILSFVFVQENIILHENVMPCQLNDLIENFSLLSALLLQGSIQNVLW